MGARHFAPMTAELLARKGEARPVGASPLVEYTVRREPRPMASPASPTRTERPANGSAFVADVVPSAHSHRISLTLTKSEFERLGIAAVKKGVNRQRLFRMAIDHYLEKLGNDYRADCQCMSADGDCCNAKLD
jgi:hypothetical protein